MKLIVFLFFLISSSSFSRMQSCQKDYLATYNSSGYLESCKKEEVKKKTKDLDEKNKNLQKEEENKKEDEKKACQKAIEKTKKSCSLIEGFENRSSSTNLCQKMLDEITYSLNQHQDKLDSCHEASEDCLKQCEEKEECETSKSKIDELISSLKKAQAKAKACYEKTKAEGSGDGELSKKEVETDEVKLDDLDEAEKQVSEDDLEAKEDLETGEDDLEAEEDLETGEDDLEAEEDLETGEDILDENKGATSPEGSFDSDLDQDNGGSEDSIDNEEELNTQDKAQASDDTGAKRDPSGVETSGLDQTSEQKAKESFLKALQKYFSSRSKQETLFQTSKMIIEFLDISKLAHIEYLKLSLASSFHPLSQLRPLFDDPELRNVSLEWVKNHIIQIIENKDYTRIEGIEKNIENLKKKIKEYIKKNGSSELLRKIIKALNTFKEYLIIEKDLIALIRKHKSRLEVLSVIDQNKEWSPSQKKKGKTIFMKLMRMTVEPLIADNDKAINSNLDPKKYDYLMEKIHVETFNSLRAFYKKEEFKEGITEKLEILYKDQIYTYDKELGARLNHENIQYIRQILNRQRARGKGSNNKFKDTFKPNKFLRTKGK